MNKKDSAVQAVTKSKFSTNILLNMNEGETYPFIKVLRLSDGPIDINAEKSKMARSMESRMTQLRQSREEFNSKRFSNRSFTSLLSNGDIVCGTVLTCVSNQAEDKTDNSDNYFEQLMELGVNDTLPIVHVVNPNETGIDIEQEQSDVLAMSEEIVNKAHEIKGSNVAYDIAPFNSMLSNGNILFGSMIKRTY